MIVDCFTFYNELDLLEHRLEYMYDHVTYFVLSECNYTHAGYTKPMYYAENMDRYAKYNDKIIYVPFNIDPNDYKFERGVFGGSCWDLEKAQRDNLRKGIINFSDDTTVIITDLDEIPNIDIFPRFQEDLKHTPIIRLGQQLFYYNLRCKTPIFWTHPVVTTKQQVDIYGADWFRLNATAPAYMDGGWHLSYFMSPELIVNKLENFAHQEFNTPEWKNIDRIRDVVYNSKDPYGRDEEIPLSVVPKEQFPASFLRVFGHFYDSN